MTIAELKEKNITELTKIARSLELPAQRTPQAGPHLQDPAGASEKEGHIFAEGCAGDPSRRLRFPALARLQLPAGPDDIYVSPSQIRSST